MADTAGRLLRLLALLQARPDWSGPQLAERLGVTTRTIRKDVDRLRSLGYPVDAAPGAAGGYRLGAGTSLPPLLLGDEQAVAVAVGLRLAAGAGIAGVEEASQSTLATLDQVLPARVRARVSALHEATVTVGGGDGVAVPAELLTTLAGAVRDRLRLRVRSGGGAGGAGGQRVVEPQRLVHVRGRWYLVAWEVDASEWRLIGADEIELSSHVGPRFRRRADPRPDLATFVERIVGQEAWHYRARVKIHAPASRVTARVPPAVVVEAVDGGSCFANVGSDSPHDLAFWVAMIDEEFDATGAPELARELAALADRLKRAAG